MLRLFLRTRHPLIFLSPPNLLSSYIIATQWFIMIREKQLATKQNNNKIYYCGTFTSDVIAGLLNEIKNDPELCANSIALYKKLLSASVELLENIVRYSNKFKNENLDKKFEPFFRININDTVLQIEAGNPVLKIDAKTLGDYIDHINKMTKEEIKIVYRETLTNGQFSTKGGAGLGLLDIARAAANKIHYQFEPCMDYFVFFRISIELIQR
jgi:hypothetical protein